MASLPHLPESVPPMQTARPAVASQSRALASPIESQPLQSNIPMHHVRIGTELNARRQRI